MDDLYDDFEEILDGVLDIFYMIVAVFIFIILLVTVPVWIVPYIVCKYLNDKEDRENGDSI